MWCVRTRCQQLLWLEEDSKRSSDRPDINVRTHLLWAWCLNMQTRHCLTSADKVKSVKLTVESVVSSGDSQRLSVWALETRRGCQDWWSLTSTSNQAARHRSTDTEHTEGKFMNFKLYDTHTTRYSHYNPLCCLYPSYTSTGQILYRLFHDRKMFNLMRST